MVATRTLSFLPGCPVLKNSSTLRPKDRLGVERVNGVGVEPPTAPPIRSWAGLWELLER